MNYKVNYKNQTVASYSSEEVVPEILDQVKESQLSLADTNMFNDQKILIWNQA